MPLEDTASETQAYDMVSTYSTVNDTYSEPPRCEGKFADRIMNRAYGGIDPEESITSPVSSGSSRKKSSRSSSNRSLEPKSVTYKSQSVSSKTSSRLGGSSRRTARYSDVESYNSRSKTSRGSTASSSNNRFGDSGSISGRSQMSALERRIEKGRSTSSKSKSSRKSSSSSRPDPNGNALAIISRKMSVDPPSVAGSVQYFEDSHGALVPVDYHNSTNDIVAYDPPTAASSTQRSQLSTCEEISQEESTRRSSATGTSSHYDSSHSQESGSYASGQSSFATEDEEESGTMVLSDATDSMMASVAENALVIREDEITVPSVAESRGDSRALVPRANTYDGAMVPHSGPRYLASAVDNHAAMVPFDSTLFESYDHTFVKCPEDIRFLFLYTFLKKNADKKIIVFFSTTHSVKFHAKLLEHFHVSCLTMHSKQKKQTFINTFFRFSDLSEGILCATDAEGRDLDIPPSVDWVVQFEPPDDPTEYILRVSRISCDSDRVGRSLLFLNPGEQGFLKYYHSAAIPVSEFEIPKLAEIQGQIEHHVNSSERLLRYAKDAYGSYLIAYASHSFRDVYNVHDLNKNDVAAAFGLIELPEIRDDSDDETSVGSGGRGAERQSAGQAPSEGNASRKTWTSQKKVREKTWLKGEKSWPHCKIKVHPKFREGYVPKEGDYME